MRIDAEAAGGALASAMEQFIAVLPDGWTRREPAALGGVTMVPVPTLNGVWAYGVDAGAQPVSALLDRVSAVGVPYCLQFPAGSSSGLAGVAGRRGMSRDEDVPLMVLADADALDHSPGGGLSVRALSPEDAETHARLLAAGFQAPVEHFRQLMTPEVIAGPGVCCYVGELDGDPVTTALSITLDDSVGIFNVATLPAHQRRGYGAMVTTRAARQGLVNGARWAWLQSSRAGYGVYQRLGFRTVSTWESWVTTG